MDHSEARKYGHNFVIGLELLCNEHSLDGHRIG